MASTVLSYYRRHRHRRRRRRQRPHIRGRHFVFTTHHNLFTFFSYVKSPPLLVAHSVVFLADKRHIVPICVCVWWSSDWIKFNQSTSPAPYICTNTPYTRFVKVYTFNGNSIQPREYIPLRHNINNRHQRKCITSVPEVLISYRLGKCVRSEVRASPTTELYSWRAAEVKRTHNSSTNLKVYNRTMHKMWKFQKWQTGWLFFLYFFFLS